MCLCVLDALKNDGVWILKNFKGLIKVYAKSTAIASSPNSL